MKAIALDANRSPAAAVSAPVRATSRLFFVDNIRVFLTILVIVHHLMVIYAGSGGWIYREGRQDDITSILGGWFCAVNQAYFMGLFLCISAYFVPGAYDRKGPGRFLVDRLIRLGIPLAVYGWVLRPLFIYLGMGVSRSLWGWYTGEYFRDYGIIGGGPLWFIEALLIFSLLYVLGRILMRPRPALPAREARFPGNAAVALFASLLGVATFLVRLVSPVNDTFAPLNFQFANFAQYIALFVMGLVAYRRNWLAALPDRAGKLWLGIAALLVMLYGPLALVGGATENVEPFLGGWHWQSLLFALWDAFLCVSACIGLIAFFRRLFNRQGSVARELSRSAYTAYLIHEPVITLLAVLAAGVMIYPLLKFALAAVIFVPLCFGLSSLIRRLPSADRVL
ncbi:MAG: acyltransferase family protein [Chloroflexi bacterium]|nr:acyltransferase family protein [Chloroflexota bacterium]